MWQLHRRFDEADDLREQLRELDVAVDDTKRQWRADGRAFDPTAWTRIAGCGDEAHPEVSSVDEAAVMALIDARAELKAAADYEAADGLAGRLRTEHMVALDDKARTWWHIVEYGGYYRVGPTVDPFTTKQVADLLTRRTAHQAAKEYEQADALHAQLTEMGVVLDTRLKTWKRPKPRKGKGRQQ